jgi:hypothetical protein
VRVVVDGMFASHCYRLEGGVGKKDLSGA